MEEKKIKGYEWKCPYCPKEIVSLSERQLEANKANHLMTHREEKK